MAAHSAQQKEGDVTAFWANINDAPFSVPISNFEAAELLLESASKRMRWVCLGHLSEDTNTPKLALATHRKILGKRLPLFVATRYEVSRVMAIE